ncbi:hypothetical protein BKA60DRAFT_547448 [Fusarium oxysporum]|nr:hypothetical protein BKA60DRAFT_547448 [Fusarium oxysporum]
MANHPSQIPVDSILSTDNKPAMPFDWNPTPEEEARIFKRWQGFMLAERSKDTSSWVWGYGIEIQSRRRDDGFVCPVSVKESTTRNPTILEAHRMQNITYGSPTVIGARQENIRHPL